MKTATSNSKYTKEIEECKKAFNIEHRLYNEDSYFMKFFKFPENHSQRIRNTDIKQIGKLFDKNISQKVITNLVSRHNGPNIAVNLIRNHVFGNLDVFHRFFYETLLDTEAFNEMVRVTTKLNFHQSDKDEEVLIDQANNLRERFYDFVANNYRINHKSSKSKNDKLKIDNANNNVPTNLIGGNINGDISNEMNADIGIPISLNIGINQPIGNNNFIHSSQIPAPLNPAVQQTMQSMQIIHPEIMISSIQIPQPGNLSQHPYQDDSVEGNNNDTHPEEIHDLF